jgi:hypothetical protein
MFVTLVHRDGTQVGIRLDNIITVVEEEEHVSVIVYSPYGERKYSTIETLMKYDTLMYQITSVHKASRAVS